MYNVEKWSNILLKSFSVNARLLNDFSTLCRHFSTLCLEEFILGKIRLNVTNLTESITAMLDMRISGFEAVFQIALLLSLVGNSR